MSLHRCFFLRNQGRTNAFFLTRYPAIKQPFARFSTTVLSSAQWEWLFSFAGLINRPHRHRMTAKLVKVSYADRHQLKRRYENIGSRSVSLLCFAILLQWHISADSCFPLKNRYEMSTVNKSGNSVQLQLFSKDWLGFLFGPTLWSLPVPDCKSLKG